MKVKREIEISPESKKILKYLEEYRKIRKLPCVLDGRTLIHLYPFRDSIKEDGSSTGFRDVIESKVVIYNFNMKGKKTKYESPRIHDRVDLYVPCHVTYFKDLSTLIEIRGKISIDLMQNIIIEEPENPTKKLEGCVR